MAEIFKSFHSVMTNFPSFNKRSKKKFQPLVLLLFYILLNFHVKHEILKFGLEVKVF